MRLLLALHWFDIDVDRWRVLLATSDRSTVKAFCNGSSEGLLRELEDARSNNSFIVPVLEADLERVNSVIRVADVDSDDSEDSMSDRTIRSTNYPGK